MSIKCFMNGLEVNYPCSPVCALFGDCVTAFESQKKANVRTNADRIRSMTDEELVKLHYSGSAHCIADDPTVCDRHDFIGNLTPCEQCYLKWLQMPAEEEDHA